MKDLTTAMRKYYWIAICAILPILVSGQHCGFDEYKGALQTTSPHLNILESQFDISWSKSGLRSTRSSNFKLPVVFHIVHNNGAANIPESQILQGFNDLNEAFSNTGFYDQNAGVDTKIEFCMAKRDPIGIATNGITRDLSPLSNMVIETDDAQLKDISRWEPTCYINIWVVNEISSTTGGTGVAGYANLPSLHGDATDGIVIEANFLGTSKANSAALVHEMGHYLGLYHTFEGGCQNADCLLEGDRVCDTPPDQSTAPVSCNTAVNTCNTDSQSGLSSDLDDMTNNYMDYSDVDCYNAFTEGQSERMRFSIDNARASLLGCLSCQNPCLNPINVNIISAPNMFPLGELYIQDINVSPEATNFCWYINSEKVSSSKILQYTFDDVGKYIIKVEASSSDNLCALDQDSICIEVFCPLETEIEVTGPNCVDLNTMFSVEHQSLGNWTELTWFVDNQPTSTDEVLMLTYSDPGVKYIHLVLGNGSCEVQSNVIVMYVGCTEICDNGIDDDGDGFIDCFDDDCCMTTYCEDFYYQCENQCDQEFGRNFAIDNHVFSDRKLVSNVNPLVGDVDMDGQTEIIIAEQKEGHDVRILILNGHDLSVENFIDIRSTGYGGLFSFTMGDVDNNDNGKSEIIVFANDFDKIYCFEHDGTLKWENNQLNDSGDFRFVDIVDFDGNGEPEILTKKEILNGQTGATMATYNQGVDFTFVHEVVAMDVLPSNLCLKCDGIEIINGNKVYTVDIDEANGSASTDLYHQVLMYSENEKQSSTSVVDWDSDGDLDAISFYRLNKISDSINFDIYVWDLQTATVVQSNNLTLFNSNWDNVNIGKPVVADVDGDTRMEIVVVHDGFLTMFDDDLSPKWKVLLDQNTGVDYSVAGFDFDHDGSVEIVFRGLWDILVLDGGSGNIIFQDICASATTYDYPIIADIDDDGSTEMICACGADPGIPTIALPSDPNYYGLKVYGALDRPWASTRGVHNQQGYFNVHINDELSIPKRIQNHGIISSAAINLNNFRVQASLSDYLPDARIEINNICVGSDITNIELQICNVGINTLSHKTSVSIYDADPTTTNANLILLIDEIGSNLKSDSCIYLNYSMNSGASMYYVVVNDNASLISPFDIILEFPITTIAECNYANNMDSIQFAFNPLELNLGQDTTMCSFGIQQLDAGVGFQNYKWQDGSNGRLLTAYNPGLYWVDVMDSCGYWQSDSIEIQITGAVPFDVGPDVSICLGDTARISVALNYEYSIEPNLASTCSMCPEITFYPLMSTKYFITRVSEAGCLAFGSLMVEVVDYISIKDTANLCGAQDSVWFIDQWIKAAGLYEKISPSSTSCDSVFQLKVNQHALSTVQAVSPIEVLNGESVELELIGEVSDIESILWTPASGLSCNDCHTPAANPTSDITYTASITTIHGCVFDLDVDIVVRNNEDESIYVPNAFSPNGDGINDTFLIYHKDYIQSIKNISIYTRWGERIYTRKNQAIETWVGWSGDDKNSNIQSGTYVYYLEVVDIHGETQILKGDVAIVL